MIAQCSLGFPAGELRTVAESITRFDVSWQAPHSAKQRRAFIQNWLDDNAGKSFEECAKGSDRLNLACLVLEASTSAEEIAHWRCSGNPAADYHVFRDAQGEAPGANTSKAPAEATGHGTPTARLQIHANRTHEFCRVGHRYLLVRGSSWVEVEVVASGGQSQGEDKGTAVVLSSSHAQPGTEDGATHAADEPPVLDGVGPGCWTFRGEC